jgi:hypothetical protein
VPKNRLFTIVQVSDLHFGDIDPNTGNSDLRGRVLPWWRHLSWLDGFMGHSANALVHLDDAFSILKDNENPLLVVTGDISASGAGTQFDLAKRYLEDRIIAGPRGKVGLGVLGTMPPRMSENPQQKEAPHYTIPGNHDYWAGDGRILPPPPPGGLRDFFPANTLPMPVSRIPLSNGRTLVLAGIDTSHDVPNHSIDKFLARGNFLSQLALLESALAGPKPDEIRVLLVHHSLDYSGWTLEMNQPSKAALKRILISLNIKIILTGHTHNHLGVLHSMSGEGSAWSLLEARCGTSTQRDEIPPEYGKSKGGKLFPNTFLAHRIYDEPGKTTWESHVFIRTTTGFDGRPPLQNGRGVPITPIVV